MAQHRVAAALWHCVAGWVHRAAAWRHTQGCSLGDVWHVLAWRAAGRRPRLQKRRKLEPLRLADFCVMFCALPLVDLASSASRRPSRACSGLGLG